MLEKKIHVRGRTTRYIEAGSGPPLLLLPSSAGRAADFFELIPALENDFHAYSLDYPGFGQSEDMPEIRGLEDLSDFILEWMDALALRRCHLLGFSMGGWIALSLALSRPDRFSRLILVATCAGSLPEIPICNPASMNFKEILDRFYYRPEIKEKLIRQKLSPAEKIEIARSSRAFEGLVRENNILPDFRHRLAEINIPTLIVGAAQDNAIPLPYQDDLQSGIPNAVLSVFQETGHAIVAERPLELLIAISSFLQNK